MGFQTVSSQEQHVLPDYDSSVVSVDFTAKDSYRLCVRTGQSIAEPSGSRSLVFFSE